MANTIAQNPAAVSYSGATSVAVTFGSALTNPSLIVAAFTHDVFTSAQLTGVSDNANAGGYAADVGPTNSYHAYIGGCAAIYSKQNTATSAATVTGSLSSSRSGVLKCYEITGAATSSALDDTVSVDLNDGSLSMDVVTTSDNCTVIACGAYGSNGSPDNPAGADTGFTVGYGPTTHGSSLHFVEHNADVGTAGTKTLTFNGTGTRKIGAYVAAAYKTSGGAAPVITVQPTEQTAANGGTATFSATATGATSYQWETQAPTGGAWSNVSGGSGATTDTYTTGTLSRSDAGRLYRLKASSAGGDTYSNIVGLRVTDIPTSYASAVGLVVGSDQSWVGFGYVGAGDAAAEPSGALTATLGAATVSAVGALDLTAAASITLGGVTVSAAGAVDITGSAAVTLGAVTSSAQGALANTGALTATLGAATISAAGQVAIAGTLSATLGAATVSSAATLALQGSTSATLGTATASATGSIDLNASASVTLGSATLSSAGTLDLVGSLSQTLGAVTLSADGGSANTGEAALTLGAATVSAVGALPLAGALSTTLGAATVSAAGALDIVGTAAVTLGAATVSSVGALDITGSTSATLGAATVSAAGSAGAAGSADITLGAATVSAAGAVAIQGASATTLGAATVSAAGAVALVGTLSQTLGAATVAAEGTGPGALTGGAAITLGAATVSAAGTVAVTGTTSATLGAATVSAAGRVDIAGALGVTLGNLTIGATGGQGFIGELAVTLGAVTASAAAGLGADWPNSAPRADRFLQPGDRGRVVQGARRLNVQTARRG